MSWYVTAKNNKKDLEEFSYGDSIRTLWDNMLRKEMDRANIHFDLENNDGWDIKTKDIDFEHNDYQYRVKARICWAGGDWEAPICYFRCQIEDRMFFDRDRKWGRWGPKFKTIIIPEKGNLNLTDGEKGGKVARAAEDSSKEEIKDNELWKEMVNLVTKRIKDYMAEYKKPEGEMDQSFKNTGMVRELTALMTSKED